MRADKIKGLVPEKKNGEDDFTEGTVQAGHRAGFNEALSTIGQKELELDVEKMAEIFRKAVVTYEGTNMPIVHGMIAISSRISEVLVVKEDK